MRTTGARLLAHVLQDAGVRYVAGIPGHSIFPFASVVPEFPALKPILVRHEAVAAFAADAYYRVSGELMAVFAHTVPGSANMASAVANAYADSSAMVVIAGETARSALGRGAYQELSRSVDGDVLGFLAHVTKRSWQAHDPLQLVEQALRALRVAQVGRPGPVALHVFQDVWEEEVEIPGWPSAAGYLFDGRCRPDRTLIDKATALLAQAERPLLLAGNGVNLARAQGDLRRFAERWGIPVATTPTGKGAFPENHELSVGVIGWVGTGAANWVGSRCDLILAVGARLTEATTSSWQPGVSLNLGRAKLVQVDIDPTVIANVFPVDVPLVGDAALTLRDLLESAPSAPRRLAWDGDLAHAKTEWEKVIADSTTASGDPLPVGPVVAELRKASIGRPVNLVCDIGKHHKWIVQQFEARDGDAIISSFGAGTMGIGPGGAIGAALGRPAAKTIAWTGDGGMAMTPYALSTAAEYRLPITYMVIDDGAFGEIAHLEETRYGRTIFSEFNGSGENPGYRLDLVALAEANGVPSQRVRTREELVSALAWAMTHDDGPSLIDVVVERRSRIPAGGGSKLTDVWNHPVYPWAPQPDLLLAKGLSGG
jgi:acetolactate synthase I/II/III large subunit